MAVALHDADVIISAATFIWPDDIYTSFKFHRVVVDESHMFQTAPGSINMNKASMVPTSMRWGATGTPASASLADFAKQLQFLCRSDVTKHIPDLATFGHRLSSRANEATSWHTFLDKVGAFTIRHTKSQRIGGADALALPDATTTTVMLAMSAQEKEVYRLATARTSVPSSVVNNGGKAFVVQRYLAAEVGGEIYLGQPVRASFLFVPLPFHYSHTPLPFILFCTSSLLNSASELGASVVEAAYLFAKVRRSPPYDTPLFLPALSP